MATLSEQTVQDFINICHWTYEAWITHRILFDDNPNGEELRHSKYGPLLGRLSNITADYALLNWPNCTTAPKVRISPSNTSLRMADGTVLRPAPYGSFTVNLMLSTGRSNQPATRFWRTPISQLFRTNKRWARSRRMLIRNTSPYWRSSSAWCKGVPLCL